MPITLITNESEAYKAAQRWRAQYQQEDGWYKTPYVDSERIYWQIVGLGNTPAPDDVASVIGNSSWSSAGSCTNCDAQPGRLVECGDEPDTGSRTVRLCEACLRAALALVSS